MKKKQIKRLKIALHQCSSLLHTQRTRVAYLSGQIEVYKFYIQHLENKLKQCKTIAKK